MSTNVFSNRVYCGSKIKPKVVWVIEFDVCIIRIMQTIFTHNISKVCMSDIDRLDEISKELNEIKKILLRIEQNTRKN